MLCAPNIISMNIVKHVGWSAGQTKSQMKECFFHVGKVVKCLTSAQHPTCWLGKCLCVLLLIHEPVCCFTILPYLLLTIFSLSFLCSLSNIVLIPSSSLCFPLMSCIPFISLCSCGIVLLLGLSIFIVLFIGGGGCLWIWSRMVSSESVLYVC